MTLHIPGPDIRQLLPNGHRAGVIYSRLFKAFKHSLSRVVVPATIESSLA